MAPSLFEKIALGLAGLTAFTIGAFILLAPHTFYAGYGITLGEPPQPTQRTGGPTNGLP